MKILVMRCLPLLEGEETVASFAVRRAMQGDIVLQSFMRDVAGKAAAAYGDPGVLDGAGVRMRLSNYDLGTMTQES
jgi:hypothetical protein